MARSLLAQFDGTCEICDFEIVADESEIVTVDGCWVHLTCAQEEGYVDE